MPSIDTTYYWKGKEGLGSWDSRCRLRIFSPHPEQIVVLLSQQEFYSETTIEESIDDIAPAVVEKFGLNVDLLTWIVEYSHWQRNNGYRFSLVELFWNWKRSKEQHHITEALWSPLKKQEAEALVGQPL